jgi:hypothetical protein
LAEHEYRCVSNEECKQNNFDKRTLSFVITPAMLAEDATCSSKTETCCHEANIAHDCSYYEADGFSCQEACVDFPQDLPKVEERKVDTNYYFPKQATCPKNKICCRRTEVPDPKIIVGAKECHEWGEEHKCTKMDRCQLETFAKKNVDTTLNSLFGPGEDADLFTQTAENTVAINPLFSPCDNPLLVCCQPTPIEITTTTTTGTDICRGCGDT